VGDTAVTVVNGLLWPEPLNASRRERSASFAPSVTAAGEDTPRDSRRGHPQPQLEGMVRPRQMISGISPPMNDGGYIYTTDQWTPT